MVRYTGSQLWLQKLNLGVFPSGQWGQTVNLLLFSFGGSNPPAPTKKSSIRTGYWIFCFCRTFSGLGGVDSNSIGPPYSPAGKKAPVQQRRPLPAAETGRSCWDCGQQGARAAQGTMQPLGAATRTHYSAQLAISTLAHQEIQYPNRVLDFLFYRNFLRAGREEGKCENQSPVLAQARRVC